jgi:hypothetical protein
MTHLAPTWPQALGKRKEFTKSQNRGSRITAIRVHGALQSPCPQGSKTLDVIPGRIQSLRIDTFQKSNQPGSMEKGKTDHHLDDLS